MLLSVSENMPHFQFRRAFIEQVKRNMSICENIMSDTIVVCLNHRITYKLYFLVEYVHFFEVMYENLTH